MEDFSGMKWLTIQRNCVNVNRLAGTAQIKPYSILEHGAQCVVLYKYWCLTNDIKVNGDFAIYLLLHDNFEQVTGDMLYPAKHETEEVSKAWDAIEDIVLHKEDPDGQYYFTDASFVFTDEQKVLFKFIDMLELYLHCVDEQVLGNNSGRMLKCLANARGYLNQMYNKNKLLLRTLYEVFENYKGV